MVKQLIVIGGATASGKTTLAIEQALAHNTEIISADSRQFYKEMAIGTAKPSPEELARVKHHFVNSLSIEQSYSSGEFEKDALKKIAKLHEDHDTVVMVGGSGLYIKAVCEGFDTFPEIPPGIRDQLKTRFEKEGKTPLLEELKKLDPEYAKTVDEDNPQRIIRALEVCQSSGQPFSTFLNQEKPKRPFESIIYCIDWPREELYDRINKRVDLMFDQGLLEEARGLHSKEALNALQTVGYQELFSFFNKEIDLEEAKRLIKRNSRRYAKRQLTWFRRNKDVIWVKPGSDLPN